VGGGEHVSILYCHNLTLLSKQNSTVINIRSRSNKSDLQASSGVLISVSQYMHASGLHVPCYIAFMSWLYFSL